MEGLMIKLPTPESINKKTAFRIEKMVFPFLLGPTILRTIAVSAKPFSTTVFKILAWTFATTTKICTKIRSS